MTFNPDYVPSGANNRANEYFRKINNVKIAKNEMSRSEFVGGATSFPLTVTVGGGIASAVNQAVFNFNVAAGDAAPGKRLVISLVTNGYAAPGSVTLTVDGVPATLVGEISTPPGVPSQWAGTFIVLNENAGNRAGVATFPEPVNGIGGCSHSVVGMGPATDEIPLDVVTSASKDGSPQWVEDIARLAGGITISTVSGVDTGGVSYTGGLVSSRSNGYNLPFFIHVGRSEDVVDDPTSEVTIRYAVDAGDINGLVLASWGPGSPVMQQLPVLPE